MMLRVFLLILIIGSFTTTALAQPGPPGWRFNALETCLYVFVKTDVAFVGHVISAEAFENPYNKGRPPQWWKVVVKPEKVLKGDVDQEQELYLLNNDSEWTLRDKAFVFLANNVNRDSFKGLFAEKWSFPIEQIKPDDWARNLEIIESIFNGRFQFEKLRSFSTRITSFQPA